MWSIVYKSIYSLFFLQYEKLIICTRGKKANLFEKTCLDLKVFCFYSLKTLHHITALMSRGLLFLLTDDYFNWLSFHRFFSIFLFSNKKQRSKKEKRKRRRNLCHVQHRQSLFPFLISRCSLIIFWEVALLAAFTTSVSFYRSFHFY